MARAESTGRQKFVNTVIQLKKGKERERNGKRGERRFGGQGVRVRGEGSRGQKRDTQGSLLTWERLGWSARFFALVGLFPSVYLRRVVEHPTSSSRGRTLRVEGPRGHHPAADRWSTRSTLSQRSVPRSSMSRFRVLSPA